MGGQAIHTKSSFLSLFYVVLVDTTIVFILSICCVYVVDMLLSLLLLSFF